MIGSNETEPVRLSAVIVAAGASRRMGFDKILTPVAGEPLVRHAVRAFEQCAEVGEIIVVAGRAREQEIAAALAGARKLAAIVPGGAERQESVANGVARATGEFVAVHDAARPLVTPEVITRCLEAAAGHGAAAAAERVTDTLQRADDGGFGAEIVDREGLWRMQTPQVFRRADLARALDAARAAGVSLTDETSALRRVGGRVFLVENPDWNIKVTTPRDVAVVEFLLQARAAASLT